MMKIPCVSVSHDFRSIFSEEEFSQHSHRGMELTDRIDALNFRIRESKTGYQSDWHVAGDPTLIIIQKGTLRIRLRNGEFKDFTAGSMFIAKDYLPAKSNFNHELHGHKAEVIYNEDLLAVHIKLSIR
jgi:hypothetical protein